MSPGVLDDTLLADPRALAALDTGGVLRSAATAGAQVRSAAHGAQESLAPKAEPSPAPTVMKLVTGLASGSGSTIGPNGDLFGDAVPASRPTTNRAAAVDPEVN